MNVQTAAMKYYAMKYYIVTWKWITPEELKALDDYYANKSPINEERKRVEHKIFLEFMKTLPERKQLIKNILMKSRQNGHEDTTFLLIEDPEEGHKFYIATRDPYVEIEIKELPMIVFNYVDTENNNERWYHEACSREGRRNPISIETMIELQ